MIAATVRLGQVAVDEGIPGTLRLVMFALGTLDVLEVVTQAAHHAAKETVA